jgi:hypothetical protein
MKYWKATNFTKELKKHPDNNDYDFGNGWNGAFQNSEYHFTLKEDQPGDYFRVCGNRDLTNCQIEIDEFTKGYQQILNNEDPNTPRGQALLPIPPVLKDKETGVIKGYANDSWYNDIELYPNLTNLVDSFGLELQDWDDAQQGGFTPPARIILQYPGNMFISHIDNELWYRNDDPEKMVRITVMLDDYKHGQFYSYGTCQYKNWRAGDFHVFDWANTPHQTANASKYMRPTLQITGKRTLKSDAVLGYNKW